MSWLVGIVWEENERPESAFWLLVDLVECWQHEGAPNSGHSSLAQALRVV